MNRYGDIVAQVRGQRDMGAIANAVKFARYSTVAAVILFGSATLGAVAGVVVVIAD